MSSEIRGASIKFDNDGLVKKHIFEVPLFSKTLGKIDWEWRPKIDVPQFYVLGLNNKLHHCRKIAS